jgi:hypothetical protein
MNHKSDVFWNNFRLNIHISNTIKTWKEDIDIDWNNISPELRESVNAVSQALRTCMELSNLECKNKEHLK